MPRVDLFPTPVFFHDFSFSDALNEQLVELIAQRRAEDPVGIQKSNILGWHSSENDRLIQNIAFKPVYDNIGQALKMILDSLGYAGLRLKLANAWVIVNPKNASNIRHTHPRSYFSGAYYIQVPEEKTFLSFHDPRRIRHFIESPCVKVDNVYTAETIRIESKAGRLVFFPSWLEHSVDPNPSDKERIVFSFNYVEC